MEERRFLLRPRLFLMHTPIPVFWSVPENGDEWTMAWSGALRCGWAASLVDRRPKLQGRNGFSRVPTSFDATKR
jgi:hypothetical protein